MAVAPDPRRPAAPTAGAGKVTYTLDPGSKAAAPTAAGTSAGGGGGLFGAANARAAAATDAVVAGIQAQQNIINQQALLRAAQQGQLGLASSRYLAGLHLPERTTADYARAAAAQRAAAAGYSGGLQQTVSDAAALVQHHLDAAGSPQTAYNQGEAAGNALYALGGTLPATQFGVTGPTVAAGLRALPAQALGYAQQLALGQLGQGQQQAAALNADIIAARAKQPTLAGDYYDTLQSAAQAAANAQATAAYHAASLSSLNNYRNAQIQQRDTQQRIDAAKASAQVDYQNARLANDAARIKETATHNTALEKLAADNSANLQAYRDGQIDLGTFNANTSRINAQTSRINALKPPKPPAPSVSAGTAVPRLDPSRSAATGVYSDQYGKPLLYGKNKQPRIYKGWHLGKGGIPVLNAKPGTKKGPGGITATSYAGLKKDALAAADLFYYGDATKQIAGLDYKTAYARLVNNYSLKPKDAAVTLNEFYAPGERGRPEIGWSPNLSQFGGVGGT